MSRIVTFFTLCGLLALLLTPLMERASANTCIDCHTSDGILKSLYKPPPARPSEGEG